MAGPTYVVLARKYRPQTFADIVGQEHVTGTLQRAIESGRVHHAYLFTGIRGVGKTTAARVLAKALNCEKGPTPSPCNRCVACVEITAGRSMDVMEIDAASNRGIEDIRQLREGVRYTTARDRFKVIIIDEVHMLTDQAFNALLKTLEEPPAHVRFILATTDAQKIPATILSRCQRFDFRRVPAACLVEHLARICRLEGIEVEEEALAVIVRQTEGSVRDSLSLLDQLIASGEGKLTGVRAQEVLGVADRKWVLETLSAVVNGDARKALCVLREVYVSGYDVRLFIGEVLSGLRDAMVLAIAGRNRELVDLTESEVGALLEVVRGKNPLDMQYYLQTMMAAYEQVRASEYPLFAAEEALVRVASAGQTAQVGALIERLGELEQRLGRALAGEPALLPHRASGPEKGGQDRGVHGLPDKPPVPAAAGGERPAQPERPAERPLLPEQAPRLPDKPPVPAATERAALAEKAGAAVRGERPRLPDKPPAAAPAELRPREEEASAPTAAYPGGMQEAFDAPKEEAGEEVAVPAPYPVGDPGETWAGFVRHLEANRQFMLAKLCEECTLTELTAAAAVVATPKGSGRVLQAESVAQQFLKFLGRDLKVSVEEIAAGRLDASIASRRRQAREQAKKAREEELRNNPKVRQTVDEFEGTIASVEVEEPEDV